MVDLRTDHGLSKIWASDYFNKERFCDDCPCCRTKIQYPDVPLDYVPVMKMRLDTPDVTTTSPIDKSSPWLITPKVPKIPNDQMIIMYGISPATPKSPIPYPWEDIKVYSVGDPNLNQFPSTCDTKTKPHDPSISFRYGISNPRDYMS
jgi:hypothetical protein